MLVLCTNDTVSYLKHRLIQHYCVTADWQGSTTTLSSIFVDWDDASFAEMEVYLAKNNIEILLASDKEGQHHVVADGLLSKDQCSELTPLDIVRLTFYYVAAFVFVPSIYVSLKSY